MELRAKFLSLVYLIRLHRPIGIFLLLWPTFWALWLASGNKPSFKYFFIFFFGTCVMRSAGCIINDIADRNVDPFVARTRTRPLAQRELSLSLALLVFVLLCLLGFSLVLQLNTLSILLSVPAIVIVCIYPLMKRVTHWPQAMLGLAFSWGVLMVFAAVQQKINGEAVLVFLASMVWGVMYDTLYAGADREDDKKIGVKSLSIRFEKYEYQFLIAIQGIFLLLLTSIGFLSHANGYYYLALIVVIGLFIYQLFIIRDRQSAHYIEAFLNNNWVGMVIFLGIIVGKMG